MTGALRLNQHVRAYATAAVGPRLRTLALLLNMLPVLFACAADTPAEQERTRTLSDEAIQRVESLGYLGFGPEVAADSASGVVVREGGCTCAGYYLLTYPVLGKAELIDSAGRIVRTWSGAPDRWERAALAPDGDLLVLARETIDRESGKRRMLIRLTFDGRRVWKCVLPAHHYVESLPDGRLALLTSRWRKVPELFGDEAVIDNGFAILSAGGKTFESEQSLYEMLAARPDIVQFRASSIAGRGQAWRDFLHANYFQRMRGGALAQRHALYAAGNLLVTLRQQDTIAMFDLAQAEVIWAWGQGEIIGPHDAKVLENGHILLFDNRSRTGEPEESNGWSRVLEVDPLSEEIVWEYRADPPAEFFSATRGTVERLDSGNTLICSSNQGRVFEVTSEGEVVWEYRTPHMDDEGKRAVLRADHYPRSFIEPHLQREGSSLR